MSDMQLPPRRELQGQAGCGEERQAGQGIATQPEAAARGGDPAAVEAAQAVDFIKLELLDDTAQIKVPLYAEAINGPMKGASRMLTLEQVSADKPLGFHGYRALTNRLARGWFLYIYAKPYLYYTGECFED